MRNLVLISLLAFMFSCGGGEDCCVGPPDTPDKVSIRGADVSFLPEIEATSTIFYAPSGEEKEVLDILKSSGVTHIRIRLWHTPANEHSSFDEVKTYAARVKAKGMKVWLTVHYSDTWADPGHQVKPEAWSEASFADLQDSVYLYTKKIMEEINPEIIQIGNEVNPGFLLPDGATSNIPNFTTLLKKGVQAVRESSTTAQIMMHFAGFDGSTWFFQQLKAQDVDYDLIGVSYYPLYHGKDFATVTTGLNNLSGFLKPIVIAETAYPFTLAWEDNTHNIIGDFSQIIPGYTPTPEGQKKFLLKVREIVDDSQRGIGFCYWGTEWIAFKGNAATDGSSWENQALFNFDHRALPGLEAFEE